MLHSKSYQLSGHNLTLIHLPFHYMPFQSYHFTTCCSNHTISPHTVPIIPFHHIPFQSYHFTTCCSNHTISPHAVPIIPFHYMPFQSYHFTTCCSNHTISPHAVPIIPFHYMPFQSSDSASVKKNLQDLAKTPLRHRQSQPKSQSAPPNPTKTLLIT